MVIFITTKSAYTEMEALIFSGIHPIWISDNILSKFELDKLRSNDIDLTLLNYEVRTSIPQELECALSTIKEHHYDQSVWVQF